VYDLAAAAQHNLSISDPDDQYTNGPNVKLEGATFYTNHEVSNFMNETRDNETGDKYYTVPSTFKSLTFNCSSDYPISWKFYIPPVNHSVYLRSSHHDY
jgi:hypothetical protein